MLDRGLTEDGAAQALGWPKNRVTARVKILELPERAQQLIGDDVLHLAAVDQLRAIGKVAPDLLDAVIAYLHDGNAPERLAREPGWVLNAAVTHAGDSKVFAAYLDSASAREIAELRLGKKTEQLYADAEKRHKHLDRYALFNRRYRPTFPPALTAVSRNRVHGSPFPTATSPRRSGNSSIVFGRLRVDRRSTQMPAHVADEIGMNAPVHEAPPPVTAREAVVIAPADDRL